MKATIFDCDGTLVDSEGLANEVLVEMVAEYGLTLTFEEALTRFRGGRMADHVVWLESRFERRMPDDFVPKLRARTREAFRKHLRPVEGAEALVRSTAGPISVASNAPPEKIRLTLALTGLMPFFEGRIYSSYEIGSWKPEPDLFLHAAHAMGVSPETCTVVEDSLPGMRAGVAAGMRVLAYQPDGVDPDLPPGVVAVERLSDLIPLLA